MGTVLRQLDRSAMEKFARDKLTELGLMTVQSINQAVETLSGGQRQRVAIGRPCPYTSLCLEENEFARRNFKQRGEKPCPAANHGFSFSALP